jgi:AcrR family transcriptional regulator
MSVMDPTKRRLLEAAGEEFAEKGFEDARVRTICKRAGLKNQAAVNYHFGDKERLYVEAVIEAHRCSVEDEMEEIDAHAPPREQLRWFIQRFIRSVMEHRRNQGWHHALMFREMLHPTSALETLVRESIRPRFERLTAVLQQICPDAEPKRLHALAFSVIGQCLHYKFAQTVSERLVGTEEWNAIDAEFLVDHIAGFSLAALGLNSPLDRAGRSSAMAEHTVSVQS